MKNGWMPWALAGLALLACVAVFLSRRGRSPLPQVETGQPISGFEAVADDELSLEKLIDRNMTPSDRENQKIKEEIDRLVQSNPENAAQVLKSWLLEG